MPTSIASTCALIGNHFKGGAVSQERSWLFRSAKTRLSLFLGLLMFTFGFLKFVNPTIDGWFRVQIQQSHLLLAPV